ncbi:MAG: metal transporter substrate-binding protein [Devosia sp.]|uniref:metal ABC transporter substrate-binding protein n=1 Tax=Devosia sp. TaxID=1871048 RepID=UPI00260A383F|nr:metal ABC transporter substrate-binding protein [Devosia sp.]MDB5589133.1 metal transporter substrate-binding protein [Devosia sp.]
MKTLKSMMLAMLVGSALAAPAFAAEVKAVATFSILGDIVARVGGERVAVTTIVGPNADTHVYEPKPSDAVAVSQADVLFVNGLGFEGWLDRFVQSSGFSGPVVVASDGVKTHEMAEEEEHSGEAEHEHGHDHGATDPHAWQSLKNGLLYVKNVAAGLCAVDAEGCVTYEANAAAYSAEISALDDQLIADIAAVPENKRQVITTHDAFSYFGEEYGVTFLAPEGISTDSEASAADVAKLITQIKADGVTALFIENMSDGRLVQQIADETGVKVGGELYADALSEPGQGAASYLDMFKHNIGLLVPAMLGK